MSPKPQASDWNKYDAILKSYSGGFNALADLPRIMQAEISWLKDYEIGFCAEKDIPHWVSEGWIYLQTDMFDVENWNNQIGLRFGMSDATGHVKYRDNYVMIQHKDFRAKLKRARELKHENFYSTVMQDHKYASKEDPRYEEIMEDGAESELESYTISPGNPKKRGRPPKKQGD